MQSSVIVTKWIQCSIKKKGLKLAFETIKSPGMFTEFGKQVGSFSHLPSKLLKRVESYAQLLYSLC